MQLPEKATLETAAALADSMATAVAQSSGPMQVDASPLKAFDSSTLALLMQTKRLAQAAGRDFSVQGVPAQLVELARLYGVEELLSLPVPAAPRSPAA